MKRKPFFGMTLASIALVSSQALATILISNGEIVSDPYQPPYYQDPDVEIVAAGGSGCVGGYDVRATFLDDNHLKVDFGNEMEASTYRKRIDRKFCSLTLKFHNGRGKAATVTQILGVAKLNADRSATAEATVEASFVGQRDTLEAQADAKDKGGKTKVLKSPNRENVEEECFVDRPLKVKATVLARSTSRSYKEASAEFTKAVILKIKWDSCYRY